jgi:hypothetical protein
MKRNALLATALLLTSLSLGCVEREFVITSDPPGAMVYRNGIPLGLTPVDDHFVYYGKFHFTLVRDKCQTLQVDEEIAEPWYEIPGIDFVSENLYPCKLRDIRRLHYRLCPLQPENQQELLGRAIELRTKGQSIGAPAPTPAVLAPQPGVGINPGAPQPAPVAPGVPVPLPAGPPGGGPPIPVATTSNPPVR